MSLPSLDPQGAITATVANVSRTTGISRSQIYRLLACDKLKAVKHGRTTLVLMDSVREYLASLPPAQFRAPRG
jgi:excisionase family DNA binding protein